MTADELMDALSLLASTDHFDEARRAASLLPVDMSITDVLRAADGVQRLARALDTRQRVAVSTAERERAEEPSSLYR